MLSRHSLRNALLPIVTVVGLRFGYMLGGAVITEQIFVWPGLGRLLITAVSQRDFRSCRACFSSLPSPCLVNLIVDISMASSIRASAANMEPLT